MNVRQLLGDRRVQIGGVVAAAGAGAVVWYRHRGAAQPASTTDNAGGDAGATPGSYVPGSFPDTSGTDVASWLGQQVPGIESDIEDWLAAHPDQPGTPPPSTTPTPTAPPGTAPRPKPTPAPGNPKPGPPKPPVSNRFVTAAAYTTKNPPWNSTLSGIAAREKTTVAALLKLNPGINKTSKIIHPGEKVYY